MSKPAAEIDVTPELARSLIETRFPDLAPARVEPLAEGWDNAVFVVNDVWVFRFPRRQLGADLFVNELRVMPGVGPAMPLPAAIPELIGGPTDAYPWSWAGYRYLPGVTADLARLTDQQRRRLAEPLGRFLRALHGFDADRARELGAPTDTIKRMDMEHRVPQARLRVRQCVGAGLITDDGPLRAIIDAAEGTAAQRITLCHADLHARNILIEGGAVSGIIDWGDVHLGDPAVDLSLAFCFLPASARPTFFDAYGPVDEVTLVRAHFRAVGATTAIAPACISENDTSWLDECRAGLRFVLG